MWCWLQPGWWCWTHRQHKLLHSIQCCMNKCKELYTLRSHNPDCKQLQMKKPNNCDRRLRLNYQPRPFLIQFSSHGSDVRGHGHAAGNVSTFFNRGMRPPFCFGPDSRLYYIRLHYHNLYVDGIPGAFPTKYMV